LARVVKSGRASSQNGWCVNKHPNQWSDYVCKYVSTVVRIKRNVAHDLTAELIVEACQDVGHTWRERTLGPAQTGLVFLMQWPSHVLCRRQQFLDAGHR